MSIDRAAQLRNQPERLEELLASKDAVFVPLWRNRNLVADNRVVRVADPSLLELTTDTVFLGLEDERPCFAVALPAGDEPPESLKGKGDFNDLRMAGPFMDRDNAELAAYARGMAYWHRHHRHCGKCGEKTSSADGGFVRVCEGCQKKHFPRSDPAMMALIIDGDRCVLARQPTFPPRMYSILAGFVEPGEDVESAVVREVREEVGLEVCDARYIRSQPWPFPSSLMLGFAMKAVTTDITPDGDELEDARWVSRDEIRAADEIFVPPNFSLAGQLIEMFLADEV
jgi:NAD+ diphosphatase